MGQTKQADDGAWAKLNILNSGVGQTEQIKFRYGPDGAARPNICPDHELGRTGWPVRNGGPSGLYLSWVEGFILTLFLIDYMTIQNFQLASMSSFFYFGLICVHLPQECHLLNCGDLVNSDSIVKLRFIYFRQTVIQCQT